MPFYYGPATSYPSLRADLSRRGVPLPPHLAEDKDIEDLKDAYGIHDKKYDEPDLAVTPGGFPERKPFPHDGPDEDEYEQGASRSREPRDKRSGP